MSLEWLFVGTLPSELYLGYAIFTTAFIDRKLKVVSGSPLRYASARNQLSLYSQPDTEAVRVHMESDEANGFRLGQHVQMNLGSQYLVGTFEAGKVLDTAARQIVAAIEDLQPIDFDRISRSLREQFRPSQPAHEVLVDPVINDIIVGTAESVLMSQVRTLRWQGLALLGYRFYEDKQAVKVGTVGDLAGHRQRIEEYGRRLASSQLFVGELEWLKSYAARVTGLMRLELEAADL